MTRTDGTEIVERGTREATRPGEERAAVARGPFEDPQLTAAGDPRARVPLTHLRTLWFNTGTLCNYACATCYIESSPRNDALAFLTLADVERYLDEIEALSLGTREIGFTGGEPFVNPETVPMLEACLSRGYETLVLTNAARPMTLRRAGLLRLRERHGDRLTLRVSLDHYAREPHERERGPGAWDDALRGLDWLAGNGFRIAVAGRTCWGEEEADLRAGYAGLFARLGIGIDAADPVQLVLFPELDASAPVPEITESCWGILGMSPGDVMCATSRMVIRRKGAEAPRVVSCTLLPYDETFDLGGTLEAASVSVPLNHPYCAGFCVLGGGSCSPA